MAKSFVLSDDGVIWRLGDNFILATYWRSQKIPPRFTVRKESRMDGLSDIRDI
jgi:hypothetical protein